MSVDPGFTPSPCVPTCSCFGRINEQHDKACLSTAVLFRRRNNEQHERDVLRHDAYLFGVEPLTNVHPFEDVIEPDENFFEDGITRRSAKLAQRALAPALASRGALSERRAPTKH